MERMKKITALILAAILGISGMAAHVSVQAAKDKAGGEEPVGGGYIVCYTREVASVPLANEARNNGMYNSDVTDSMHLGYSEDLNDFEALNHNTGVLFAKDDEGSTKVIKSPHIFRMKDGSFGILAIRTATRTTTDEAQDDRGGRILFFTSADLIHYEEVGFLTVGDNTDQVKDPACTYDALSDTYLITWTSAATGAGYVNKTSDFKTIEEKEPHVVISKPDVHSGIPYAIDGNVISVTAEEADYILGKLRPVTNTTVENPTISVRRGNSPDLSEIKVTADYSDGSSAEKVVIWDEDEIGAVNFGATGTYEVSGTVKQISDQLDNPQNDNYPFLVARADPEVVKFNGKYYFTSTTDNANNTGIYIREADSVVGLKKVSEHLIYDEAKGAEGGINTPVRHWAPELHVINGKLCILLANNIGTAFDVQCVFMQLTEGGDPTKYADWEAPKRFLNKNGGMLNNAPTAGFSTGYGGITLDMTHFAYNGRDYVSWAQRNFGRNGGTSDIWIGEIDPQKPWQLINDPIMVIPCEYGWERNESNRNNSTPVNEGPFVIITEDKLYMTYSGSATDETYCVGMAYIELSDDVDFMNLDSWVKINYPVLTGFSVVDTKYNNRTYDGPGHNSYVEDNDGNLINVFHARRGRGSGGRDTFLRIVHFGADGFPILDMAEEREILPENKEVTMTVHVVTTDALAAEIARADQLDFSKYTEGSAANVRRVLEDAKVIYSSGSVSQEEIDHAVNALKDAVTKLALKTVPVESVSLNQTRLSMDINGTARLAATVLPSGATNKNVTWRSSKASVAAVDTSGKITALKAGTAIITVTTVDGNKMASCEVTVKATRIQLSHSSLKVYVKQSNKVVKIKSSVPSGETITSAVIDKKNIASVSVKKGIMTITGKKKGAAIITVTSTNGGTAKLNITVRKAAIKKLTLPKKASLQIGKTRKLKLTIKPNYASGKKKWSSSDRNIASVNSKGVVTGKRNGTVKISVKSSNGKRASCTVTVSSSGK